MAEGYMEMAAENRALAEPPKTSGFLNPVNIGGYVAADTTNWYQPSTTGIQWTTNASPATYASLTSISDITS